MDGLGKSDFLDKSSRKHRGKTPIKVDLSSRKRKRDESEVEAPNDQFDINVRWSTLSPEITQALSELVFEDYMAIKCREQIVSHLTTNDITAWTEDGNPVRLDQEYDHLLQTSYKKFVSDAFLAHLIHGVVPVVLVPSTSTGYFFPIVPELGTYTLQVAFIAENEKKIYRAVRPIEYCARPQDLQDNDRMHTDRADQDITSAGNSLAHMLNRNQGSGGVSLEGNPDAHKGPLESGGNSQGYFIDRSISVIDIFGTSPGPRGEVRSPLKGILEQVSVSAFSLDAMYRAQDKMLRPPILVEKEKDKNVDKSHISHGDDEEDDRNADPGLIQSVYPGGGSGSGRFGRNHTMEDSLDNLLSPLPPMNTLSRRHQRAIRGQQAELIRTMRNCYQNPAGGNPGGMPGGGFTAAAASRQFERDRRAILTNEVEGRLRYCPDGYKFSSSYSHPETSAGQHYFTAREHLDLVICMAFGVPVGMVQTQKHQSRDTFQGFLYMFQRSITDRATKIQRFLTILFRQSLLPASVHPRIVSIKPVYHNFEKIDADNNRLGNNGPGNARSSTSLFDTVGAGIPEYRIPTAEVPVMDPQYILTTGSSKPGQPKEPVAGTDGPEIGRPNVVTVVPTLAEDANEGEEDQVYEKHYQESLVRDINEEKQELVEKRESEDGPDKKKRKVTDKRQEGGVGVGEGEKRNGLDQSIDINKLELRLDPLVYSNSPDTLRELVASGIITPEQHQRALCQVVGFPDPMRPKGVSDAWKNQEYLWTLSGRKSEEEYEERIAQREFERQMKMTKLQASLAPKPKDGEKSGGSSSGGGSAKQQQKPKSTGSDQGHKSAKSVLKSNVSKTTSEKQPWGERRSMSSVSGKTTESSSSD